MKKLLSILFTVFHIGLSYWGCNQLSGQWVAPHARSTSVMVIAMLTLLVVSSLYLLLVYINLLGYSAAIVCVISNLVLWGIPWLFASGVIMFGGAIKYLISPPYLLVSISLAMQYFVVLPFLKKSSKQ